LGVIVPLHDVPLHPQVASTLCYCRTNVRCTSYTRRTRGHRHIAATGLCKYVRWHVCFGVPVFERSRMNLCSIRSCVGSCCWWLAGLPQPDGMMIVLVIRCQSLRGGCVANLFPFHTCAGASSGCWTGLSTVKRAVACIC
jgi:hypothetical protein